MTHRQEQEGTPITVVASLQDEQEQNLLSFSNIQLLWPDIVMHKHVWKAFGQQILRAGDIYAEISARRAISYEELAREQYRSACQYHQRTLHSGAAMQLGKTIRSLGRAIRRWGYTAIWLKRLCDAEQTSPFSDDVLYRMLLEAAQQQHRLCTTLNSLQRMYFAYCFKYALLPSLLEEDGEEKTQQ